MKINKKNLLKSVVVASSATALVFFSYKAYKAYKEELNRQKELERIENEEKIANMKAQVDRIQEQMSLEQERTNELSMRLEVEKHRYEDEYTIDEEFTDVREVDENDIYYEEEEGIIPEHQATFGDMNAGVEELKYGPNTDAALMQYKMMRISELPMEGDGNSGKVRDIIWRLFDIPFEPVTSGDENLLNSIMYEREEFFGEASKWNHRATFAEVILYFSELAQFDMDYNVEVVAGEILKNLGITINTGEYSIEKLIRDAVNHTHSFYITHDDGSRSYYNSMFGLDDETFGLMVSQIGEDIDEQSFMKEYNAWLFKESEMEENN